MYRHLFNILIIATTCLSFFSIVQADDKKIETKKPSYYLLGNSLTMDTLPYAFDGDLQYHIDCGKSLPYMFEHPEKPCVKQSALWNKAFKEKQYTFVSFQPHYGSTLKTDVETITKWMKMQPKAIVIIHSGWARQKTRAEEYISKETTGKMVHAPGYYTNLIKELKKTFPQREFRQTHAIDLLDQIARDIENKKSPFKDIAELHRDKIHMKTETGRYLMHNAMRIALGQPISDKHFKKTTEEHKAYFNKLLKAKRITYPYVASEARKAQIMTACLKVKPGMTLAQARKIAGDEDQVIILYEPKKYKPKQLGYTYWYYLKIESQRDDYDASFLRISVDNADKVTKVDYWGFDSKAKN